ncbi:hypothetical protein NQ315_004914, partial [Exocentrus adspersus]
EYLRPYRCYKSDPEFSKCVLNGFENSRDYVNKGIPELSLPALDPFELPLMTVNRTVNELVSINAVCRNIRVIGGSSAIIDDLKADPIKHTGEIRVTVPWLNLVMDYDVLGQLLVIPLKSSGHFEGNFTNTQMHVKGSLKKYKRDGEEYFKVNKVDSKITVGDGRIQLTAEDPDRQLEADLITFFFNENPRRVMDAVNPIFIDSTNDLIRAVSDQILSTLPASEWLPA